MSLGSSPAESEVAADYFVPVDSRPVASHPAVRVGRAFALRGATDVFHWADWAAKVAPHRSVATASPESSPDDSDAVADCFLQADFHLAAVRVD